MPAQTKISARPLSPVFDEYDFAPGLDIAAPVKPAKSRASKSSKSTRNNKSVVQFEEKENTLDEPPQQEENDHPSQQPSQKDHISSYLTSPPSYGEITRSNGLGDDPFEPLPEPAIKPKRKDTLTVETVHDKSASGLDEYAFIGDYPQPVSKQSKSSKKQSPASAPQSSLFTSTKTSAREEKQRMDDEDYSIVMAADAKRGARKGKTATAAARQNESSDKPTDNTVSESVNQDPFAKFDYPSHASSTPSSAGAKKKKAPVKTAAAKASKPKPARATKPKAKSKKKTNSDEEWNEYGTSTAVHDGYQPNEDSAETGLGQSTADPFDFGDTGMHNDDQPYEEPTTPRKPTPKPKPATKRAPKKTTPKTKQSAGNTAFENDDIDNEIDSLMQDLGGDDDQLADTLSVAKKNPRKTTKRGRKSTGAAESAAVALCEAIQAELNDGSVSGSAWLHEHHSEILGSMNAFSFEGDDGGLVSQFMEDVINQTEDVVTSGNDIKGYAEELIKESISRVDKIRAMLSKRVADSPAPQSDEYAQRAKRIKVQAETHHNKILSLLNTKS